MVGDCGFELNDGSEMKDILEYAMTLEESKLFYHIACNRMEVKEFHKFC